MARGQCQFDAASTAAHDGDSPLLRFRGPYLIQQQLPAGEKLFDRFNRHGMDGRPGDALRDGSRAKVDREKIEIDRGPIRAEDPAFFQIEARDNAAEKLCARELAKWAEIDMSLVDFIVAGDQAG